MHINTQPSYDPAATPRAVFPLRKLPEELSKIPSGFTAEDTLIYWRYYNLVFLSFG